MFFGEDEVMDMFSVANDVVVEGGTNRSGVLFRNGSSELTRDIS
jgi:hypothetical protein